MSHNVVIRNPPEADNERIDFKNNAQFRDGLEFNYVSVAYAERKKKSQEGSHKPGLIVATLKSISDKKLIISAKNNLNDHRQYSAVYINHDKSRSERKVADNIRTTLSAIKQGDTILSLRGVKVVRTDNTDRSPWNRPEPLSSRFPIIARNP